MGSAPIYKLVHSAAYCNNTMTDDKNIFIRRQYDTVSDTVKKMVFGVSTSYCDAKADCFACHKCDKDYVLKKDGGEALFIHPILRSLSVFVRHL